MEARGARARNRGLSEQSSVVLLLFDLLGRAELSRDGQVEFARTAQFSSVQIDWISSVSRERGCLCNGQGDACIHGTRDQHKLPRPVNQHLPMQSHLDASFPSFLTIPDAQAYL